jgi:hypothetical protein
VPFGGGIQEKIFSGGVPLLPKFQRAFFMQIEKVENLLIGERLMQNSKTDLEQIDVKESTDDATSGLARPLEAEIVFPPFSAIRKALITSKHYKIDGIIVNKTRIENNGRSIDW